MGESQGRRVRCTETGRGTKGSTFVCDLPNGDQVILKAYSLGGYQYAVFSEQPRMKYSNLMYAKNRRDLARKLEEWLEHTLS